MLQHVTFNPLQLAYHFLITKACIWTKIDGNATQYPLTQSSQTSGLIIIFATQIPINTMASLRASLPTFLYTNRLTLELFDYTEPHYNCLLAAMNSPTAHLNMGDYGIRTPTQFDALNAATRLSPSTCGGRIADTDVYYLLRTTSQKNSGPLIGAVSLAQRGESTPPDMGWCILEPCMGHAYAAEAGKELLRIARLELGVKEIVTWPGTENQRSIRVAQKIGFVEGGVVRTSDGGLNMVYILPGMVFDSGIALSIWGGEKVN